MGIILWVIFGAIAGWIASMLAGRNDQQGWLGNIIVGIVGALIGGFIARMLGVDGVTGFNIWSMLIAIGGSLLLLMIVGMFKGKNRTM